MESKYKTGRREKLPAPMTQQDTGLISLLTRNIGKDLTRISMPVTLNEPLNTLQVNRFISLRQFLLYLVDNYIIGIKHV